MIYFVIAAVALFDFLLILSLALLAHTIVRGPSHDPSYAVMVQARALIAAISFTLSAAIIQAWEMGVIDG